MDSKLGRVVSFGVLLALVLWLVPTGVRADGAAVLEGLVLDVDGRPAVGYRVHLIGDEGRAVADALTSEDGLYAFAEVPSGRYSMGIETPEGDRAPVLAPPMRVARNQLARRDLKLVQADEATLNRATTTNSSLGLWFRELGPGGRIGLGIALAAIVYTIVEALDDDSSASPMVMTP